MLRRVCVTRNFQHNDENWFRQNFNQDAPSKKIKKGKSKSYLLQYSVNETNRNQKTCSGSIDIC